ncbi:MAG TPA: NADH:ubiquinone oxidoreductase subunit NDUFA12 [Paracoccus sp. (in: a-proteobacteria)]|uniref:NADH:ubiquinone oxidoreductase subunit NDUFA12 n=1 Tax=Paracoccus sp. TaxID=267 RepID=UPI002C1A1C56|nr:NADH:ubiquinone oxidoreductase subunit NDUFA12 [Paracoccus sp. (in: a-proteobacteria)]HWL59150.1 NADH:ubiquinone oxidoreductase subunit NDUFA12 [Paracoccus sp. (in: a-proteobacteria)]
MSFLLRALTWWNSQTINTQVWTRLYGEKVGEDAEGNIYYQSGGGKRRWVIYNGESEASRVSPEWHGWLHHTYKQPPTTEPMQHKPWEKEHVPNMTGTEGAYHPAGSLLRAEPARRRDYDAWQPE